MRCFLEFPDGPDGRLAYHDQGEGEVVVMVQGVSVAGSGWTPQVEALSEWFRTLTIDNRGVGETDLPTRQLSIETMADDVVALVDALGVGRFHLVGHSMGGLIAQEAALRDPERLLSLSLLCTFPNGRDGARVKPGMLGPATRSFIGSRRSRRRGALQLVFPRAYLDSVDVDELAMRVGALFGRDLSSQPSVVRSQLAAMKAFDVENRLAKLAAIRTLVMSGAEDIVAPPSSGEALAQLIPGSKFVSIAGAGHALPIQLPDLVNEALREHLKGPAV